MTIASTTSRISYTGDNATTVFAVPFLFQVNADLIVYLQDTTGAATLQLLSTNYTLTGAGVAAGGTLTFIVAPPSGYLISIYRDPALTQATSYNNNDPFPAKSHENALDKAVMIDQRTRDLALRSLHIPDSESSATVTALGTIAQRANKLVGFDSGGSLIYPVGPSFVGNTSTGVAEVDSKLTAQVTIFPISVNLVRTYGAVTVGDGAGREYTRGTGAGSFTDGGGVSWVPATQTTVSTAQIASAIAASMPYSGLTSVPALLTQMIAAFAASTNIWSTGDVKLTIKTVADTGWVLFDDGTIGDVSSGASNRANADTQALFNILYASPFTDATAPLLTSVGGATTRGAQGTAAAAYAAHCRISLFKTLGRALAIAGSGAGLTARTMGVTAGLETTTILTANLPAYTPAGSVSTTIAQTVLQSTGAGSTATTGNAFAGVTPTATSTFTGTPQGGTSTPMNTIPPETFLNAMVRL